MLSVNSVEASYEDSQALFGMSFDVGTSEFVTLLGRNGMGKTTTIRSIMGILPVSSGKIFFEEKEITNLSSFRIAQAGIGLVPEGRQIFPNLTVRENLIATAVRPSGLKRAWTIDRIIELFPALRERLNNMGGQLSGGEQQMLAIGRALMTNPRLLILDEATEGLAPKVRSEIWSCLKTLRQEAQAILVIDKNLETLLEIADRHYIVEKGSVVWSGTSTQLRENKQLQKKYLGV
ncbi:MAG: ABC transporter ATP-binding protein [Alphaproteobacteria bacterium]|nr:ABC transporter ATP-binding protein [Alphaproteobacteria bacterium]PPR14667.1 MAG: High-affinity branched-chain amino acid transport ATP-binding protein LivF [Alphaproteobacteria bacterium MarineAlpha12_Bin1]|tara:strand:- start:871 stop:1572 length:702 start_codon:yes stop_codon:yes gene_type:complete